MPVVGFINGGSADASVPFVAAFRKGLNDIGFVDGQNVGVEYHWLEGKYDQLPALVADLVRRRVALITTPASTLEQKRADAIAQSSPTADIAIKKYGAFLLLDLNNGGYPPLRDYPGGTLVANKAWLSNNKPAAVAVVRALWKAMEVLPSYRVRSSMKTSME
jgi:hypothetical protein